MSLEDRLASRLALALPDVPPEAIPSASSSTVPTWDSLATVNIVSMIEEEFALQVPLADLEHFVSYEKILAYLKSRVE
ncbi:MAG: acyl carrier protein [Myxococcales bacterium]